MSILTNYPIFLKGRKLFNIPLVIFFFMRKFKMNRNIHTAFKNLTYDKKKQKVFSVKITATINK